MKREDSIVSDLSCWAVMAVFVAGLAVLAVRLKEVQVDGAPDYNYEKARQSVRRVQTAGPRGRILDRRGRVLAENRRALSIVCNAAVFRKRTWDATESAIAEAVSNVAAVVGRPSPLTVRAISRHVRQSLAMPLVAWRDLSEEELARFSEHSWLHPGFSVAETEERVYPNGCLACHLVGYVGRDRAHGEEGDERFSFREFDLCGRSGLELYYDGFLRGVAGEKKLLVDARGFSEREWVVSEARRGPDLCLTIDADIQRVAEEQLAGVRGACVALDPRDGSLLAMASSPGFDLNEFVPMLSREVYSRYLDDPAKPLLNRASGGTYAPGSTFKPVTALAGLEMGYPADADYDCSGVFALGAMRLHCARRWGHGPIDIKEALKVSCNTFFCNLGMDIGTNAVMSAARAFGLGERTGIDFPDDRAGLVPNDAWKRKTYGERWYPGDLAQMSIGQGMLLASPLQMALVAGAVGTGYLVTPHLKYGVPPARRALPFSRRSLEIVREGMRLVVAGGSGSLGGEGVDAEVCGKTGTAEYGLGENRRKNTWFIAYAPAGAPRAAVALVVENGESGGGTAAPRVAAVLRRIFNAR
ncbi:MAG: penicillin-binding protein 2 [Kiritimatiellae bacterium]|nr:penicillin-binding protein 2 [Kiritimatiellia bacterium]